MLKIIKKIKKDKNVIFWSSIILVLSVFLWDIKIGIFQTKFIIILLLAYNLVLYKKEDLKYYLYFLSVCFLLLIHLYYSDKNAISNQYIFISILFLFIYISVLYKIQTFFDKILKKSVLIFIIFSNIVFILELIVFDFYVYDKNLIGGDCTFCHKDNYFIISKIFIEKSHIGMMSAAVILYNFFKFKDQNKLEKINVIFFTLFTFIFLLSLTLILGIIISSLILLIFGFLKNFKDKIYILVPIFLSLYFFLTLPNCWLRIYQVTNLEILYKISEKENLSKNLGAKLSLMKLDSMANETIYNSKNEFFFKKLDELIIENNVEKKILINKKNINDQINIAIIENFTQSRSPKNEQAFEKKLREVLKDYGNVVESKITKKDIDQIITDGIRDLRKTNFFLNSSINLTTIVHLNHYMLALKTLQLKPLGFGFQNYKSAALEFSANNKMLSNYKVNINLNIGDGASNLNKLLVEFSYLNILFIIIFILFYLKGDMKNSSKVFIFTIIITQLFRAAGYFNGGFLFVIIVGTLSIFIKQKK